MDLEPAGQQILIVLLFAHVLLDHYLPPEEGWGATPCASALIGAVTALCFFEPAGLPAGLTVALGYAAIRRFLGGRTAQKTASYIVAHAGVILLLILSIGYFAGPDSGAWLSRLAGPPLQAIVILTGLLFMWWTGSNAVGLIVRDLDFEPPDAIPNAGRLIGQLERTLILFLVIAGVPSGIGFLIAAKSVLRFGDVTAEGTDNRKMAEYVIIGTLASFTFAIPVAYATAALLQSAQ